MARYNTTSYLNVSFMLKLTLLVTVELNWRGVLGADDRLVDSFSPFNIFLDKYFSLCFLNDLEFN